MKYLLSLFSKKQNTIGSASFVLMTMVLASRVLGLLRDRLLAARFLPEELGTYFAAFRLPNLVFELLVIGAVTSAFIPVFTRHISQHREGEAMRVASILINVSLVIFILFLIPLLFYTEQISRLFAPGFSEEQIEEMVSFTKIIIIFQIPPLLIGNFLTGILQSYNYFLIPALAPVIYNIGIIISIICLSPVMGLYAPVVGVGIGAVLFMAIHLPLLRSVKYSHAFLFDLKNKGVREVAKLMAPRTLGLAASQVDTTVDLMMASLLGARMVTILNFAQHLQHLPVGLFGATIAQAALPSLSKASIKEDGDEFKKTIIQALHQVLFFVFPASVLFIVLRIPIVRLIFGAARFDWEATVLTSKTLSAFSISLFAQSIVHILARGFYALYNSKTPVAISIATILFNTALSIIFVLVLHMPVWSLGISTSIASILHAVALLYFLNRRVHGFSKRELFLSPIKMGIASLITGIMLYVPLKLFDQLVFDTTRTFGLILLTGTAGSIGLTSYVFFSWVLDVGEVKSFITLLKNMRKRDVVLEPAGEVINSGVGDKVT